MSETPLTDGLDRYEPSDDHMGRCILGDYVEYAEACEIESSLRAEIVALTADRDAHAHQALDAKWALTKAVEAQRAAEADRDKWKAAYSDLADDHASNECTRLGEAACQWKDPLHFHHDGCTSEYAVEQENVQLKADRDKYLADLRRAREAIKAWCDNVRLSQDGLYNINEEPMP